MKKIAGIFLAALLMAGEAHAQVPISGLPAASPLTGTEVLPVVQSGVTRKATTAQLGTDIHPYGVFVAPGTGLDLYVATTGTDAGNCQTSGAPCHTINYALAQGLQGDLNGGYLKIHLGVGTFSENVTVNGQLRGGAGSGGFLSAESYPTVELIGVGSGSTTLAGGQVVGGQSFCYAVLANNYATVALQGLTITANAGGSACLQSDIYAQFFGTIYVVSDVKLGASNGISAFAEEYGAIVVTPGVGTSGALTFTASAPGAIGLSDNSSFQSDGTLVFTGSPTYANQLFVAEGNSTIKLSANPPTSGTATGKLADLSTNSILFTYQTGSYAGATISSCRTGGRTQLAGVSASPGCAYAAPAQIPTGVTTLNPTGTTSVGSFIMMGLGAAGTPTVFKPGYSGAVDFTISGTAANSVGGDGAQMTVFYGSGAAPANAASTTGTECGPNPRMISATGGYFAPFSIRCVISGLAPGTQYWFDIALAAITGGTATVSNIQFSAVELTQ